MASLEKAIAAWIAGREKLGDQGGGSGHLGNNSLEIVAIEEPTVENGRRIVRFSYRIHTLTEFDDEDFLPPPPLKTGEMELDPA